MRKIITNRKASFEYFIRDTYEAGIVLHSADVKSIRNGNSNITGAFAKVINNEIFLFEFYMGGLTSNKKENTQPQRKILLHRKEIYKISKLVEKQGYTLIPLSLYFNDRNILKVELGVCEGKNLHDKKQSIKERDLDREMKREI
jgi:SsrA-binding protein